MDRHTYQTPLMQQFEQIKTQYPDCLVLFRLGDFYELFAEDAVLGSKILDITLTRKAQSKGGDVPMAGIPYHALESYLPKLVQAGYKVAIAEQIGEPDGRTLVERKVIRIVTPGTTLGKESNEKNNLYISAITQEKNTWGIATADLSTGELQVTELSEKNPGPVLLNELARLQPREIILPTHLYNNSQFLQELHSLESNISVFHQWTLWASQAENHLKRHFSVQSLAGFQLHKRAVAQEAVAALLGYLEYTQQQSVSHLQMLRFYEIGEGVTLDRATLLNLELFSTLREGEGQGTLIHHLDQTITAMGARLLRQWVKRPSNHRVILQSRQEAVAEFCQQQHWRDEVRSTLENIGDMERLLGRISLNLGNPRDIVRLQQSLESTLTLYTQLTQATAPFLLDLCQQISPELGQLAEYIHQHIESDPPIDPKHGGVIRSGVNEELDTLRQQAGRSTDWMLEFEKTERQTSGIPNLKVRSNKVFGFYIEISRSHLGKVPQHYERKQTLVNAERFVTNELKEQELLLLTAQERVMELELSLLDEVVKKIVKTTRQIQAASQVVGTVDCLATFGQQAQYFGYVQPELNEGGTLTIIEGRHPVVERLLGQGDFVPNSTKLDTQEQQMMVITGPNMGGKSVYMRQVALITLLAHLGSFVPAQSANISLVDRIFVRSGAADMISAGLSTFMVEMVEVAYILRHATAKSLIIMDEVGRGTSTYDGISLAWAIAEYLATEPAVKAKTLFATHYHELQKLAQEYPQVKNFQVLVKEHQGHPVFLHTLAEGAASHSFGVAVAELAGVPERITQKAKKVLHELEQRQTTQKKMPSKIVSDLKNLDLENITPIQAMALLQEWQELLK